MSPAEARAVLAAAFEHCAGDVEEVQRRLREAHEQVNGLSSAQISGPDAVPESVDAAFDDYRQALDDLAGECLSYLPAASEVPA